ncbi:MAG: two-component system LytT family response regulator [Pseudohongiellaceae bacterium]|jgi:two-component system LytT family response regulator
MAALRVVIADDEPMARSILRRLLAQESGVELVAECAHGQEALAALAEHHPEILFLDVQMPELDGFGVLAALQPEDIPAVVFTTAYDRYALAAFDVAAVDYLLKPFDDDRFRQALQRAVTRVGEEGQRESDGLRRLAVHHLGRVELLDVESILWVEAADQYVKLHTFGGSQLARFSMSSLEERLDGVEFARIHRSAIVALRCVLQLVREPSGTGRVLIDDDKETWLPVSRSRMATLRKQLG